MTVASIVGLLRPALQEGGTVSVAAGVAAGALFLGLGASRNVAAEMPQQLGGPARMARSGPWLRLREMNQHEKRSRHEEP